MHDADDKTDRGNAKEMSLKKICLQAVRKYFAVVGTEAVVDLPRPLVHDLLPHLTVCQLDELQPALNLKGISTYSGWVGILKDILGTKHVVDLHTEEEAKREVMRMLFRVVFYGFTNSFVDRNISNVKTPAFLLAAAKHVKHFLLITSLHKPLESLTAEHEPLLNVLEKNVTSVGVSQNVDLSKEKTQAASYVFHRLVDHGRAKELVVHTQCPVTLAWLLRGRGSQSCKPESLTHTERTSPRSQAVSDGASGAASGQDDEVRPCKRSKLDPASVEESEKGTVNMDPHGLCQGSSAGVCPRGQIERLEVSQCSSDTLRVLNAVLPTFFCLRSLTLHSMLTFSDSDMLDLARALKQLSESACSSLTELSVSVLAHTELVDVLLDASPNITSLCVEVLTVHWAPRIPTQRPVAAVTELPLHKMTLKVAQVQIDGGWVTSLLRRCPHLTSLHVVGMRLPAGSSQRRLLTTLSESIHCLRILHLEDLNLSDCLSDILRLLSRCKLEEMQLNDCLLLEKSSDRQQSVQLLVSALKNVPSLHTLSLAQNRLAKNVCVLAELFSDPSPSSVRRLDISSNFIQPADLLEFSKALSARRPPHILTLDLRRNPGDRDPDTWNAALSRLRPFCVVLDERWKYTNVMADHISNM